MNFLHAPDIQAGRPLKDLTTFGIGGPAEYLALPATESRAVEIINLAHAAGMGVRILGGGSDLLVLDAGVGGLVVKLPDGEIEVRGKKARLAAGMRLSTAIRECGRMGLSGLEELSGIPGTVGGAAARNAGAFGRTFGECVARAGILEGERVEEFSKSMCGFGYRSSALLGKPILWVEVELAEVSPANISRRIGEVLVERRNKFPAGRSAGCVFKNGRVGAGALIENLGLKGARSGRAEVSQKHANFIINLGGAAADDVCRLIDMIRREARIVADVELQLEVEIWGE